MFFSRTYSRKRKQGDVLHTTMNIITKAFRRKANSWGYGWKLRSPVVGNPVVSITFCGIAKHSSLQVELFADIFPRSTDEFMKQIERWAARNPTSFTSQKIQFHAESEAALLPTSVSGSKGCFSGPVELPNEVKRTFPANIVAPGPGALCWVQMPEQYMPVILLSEEAAAALDPETTLVFGQVSGGWDGFSLLAQRDTLEAFVLETVAPVGLITPQGGAKQYQSWQSAWGQKHPGHSAAAGTLNVNSTLSEAERAKQDDADLRLDAQRYHQRNRTNFGSKKKLHNVRDLPKEEYHENSGAKPF